MLSLINLMTTTMMMMMMIIIIIIIISTISEEHKLGSTYLIIAHKRLQSPVLYL
jgi:hypothetical protein